MLNRTVSLFSILILFLLFTAANVGSASSSKDIRVYSIKAGDYIVTKKVEKTPEEWSEILPPDVFHITRQQGTERAFSGKYWNHKEHGIYKCVGCGQDLFHFPDPRCNPRRLRNHGNIGIAQTVAVVIGHAGDRAQKLSAVAAGISGIAIRKQPADVAAAKRADQDHYMLYDVVGWRGYYGGRVVGISRDIPDRYWYGAKPRLLKAHRGPAAEALIDAVDAAARAYPWHSTYKVFPGPNSNTFTAWIARQVPGLGLELPFSAIGSGYASRDL